ncbi:MAG: DUF2442 domain-containing protein [Prolixibacteraceae bacterium]
MYPAVKNVKPIENYNLILIYENGEKRQFDMKPFLNKGIFKELKEVAKFNTVKVCFDAIEWENKADLDPEVLYEQSICINK